MDVFDKGTGARYEMSRQPHARARTPGLRPPPPSPPPMTTMMKRTGRDERGSDREGERVTAAFDWFVCFSCL